MTPKIQSEYTAEFNEAVNQTPETMKGHVLSYLHKEGLSEPESVAVFYEYLNSFLYTELLGHEVEWNSELGNNPADLVQKVMNGVESEAFLWVVGNKAEHLARYNFAPVHGL